MRSRYKKYHTQAKRSILHTYCTTSYFFSTISSLHNMLVYLSIPFYFVISASNSFWLHFQIFYSLPTPPPHFRDSRTHIRDPIILFFYQKLGTFSGCSMQFTHPTCPPPVFHLYKRCWHITTHHPTPDGVSIYGSPLVSFFNWATI